MSEKKITLAEVQDIVENEGLGYAVQCYLNPKNIENKQLSRLWEEAREKLDEIEKLLW